MKKKITVRFGLFVFLLCSIVYAQNDTLKVIGTTGKIGTTNHIVPIYLKNNVHSRGLQLTLNYPTDLNISTQDITATSRTADFIVRANADTPGTLIILIYSMDLETIPPDTGAVININFSVLPGALPGYYPLTLFDALVLDEFGQNLDVERVNGVFTITNGVIPVELAAFNGYSLPQENKISLEWRTCSETNNYGFEILRGESRGYLEKIGFVPGQGTTSLSNDYNFVDSDLTATNYFYQLNQIDFDGSTQLSEIIEVAISLPLNHILSQNYPNPFSLTNSNTTTSIRFQLSESELVDIKIYDLLGREVKTLVSQKTHSGTHSTQWDGRNNLGAPVSPGLYYYTMKTKKFSTSKKMIILE